ncbi:TPA: restriction endonuclease subunit S [Pseudomonas aeruginosa]
MSWPISKLGAVISFIRGVTFTPEDQVEPFSDGSTVVMRTKNVQVAGLDQGDLIAVPSGFVRRKEQSLREGDILVSSANSWELVGKASYVPKLAYEATAGGFISIVRAKETLIDSRYLYHWVACPSTQHKIRHCGRQTTNISNLDVGRFQDLDIPLPPLPEQKRIAAILDKADAIRRKRQQAIQLADDFLRAVFLDMFGDPVSNPKGWPKKSLKLLGKSATGRTPPSEKADMWGEGLPFVTPGDLSGRVDSSVREVTQEGAEHSKVCRTGSLLVCCIGATIGKVGIAGCPVTFNQQINAQEWGAEISDVYGFFVFKLFPGLVSERAIQTTLPILKKSLFDEIEIPVPAKDMQEKFAALAQKISSFSARHESGVEMPIFESLSQLAFSGKL